jgi:nicotinamide mononucleotide (NMN) deamidase PncC
MRFGPETEQALRNFQSRHGLTVDGIAGPETFAALHPRAGSHMADGLIRQGDQGTGVLGVQTALRQHGHELGTDAVFGPETDRAVREFQRDHGLAVDGIVGPRTSAALVATRHAALSPDQQRHLQLAREQLGPALSACGHSPEQIERICTAAMSLAQQHAERGPVKGFFLSKDGERVAVVQHSPPMSEMGIGAALQRSGEQHLALAQQTALEQGQEALRHGAPGPTTSGRVMA